MSDVLFIFCGIKDVLNRIYNIFRGKISVTRNGRKFNFNNSVSLIGVMKSRGIRGMGYTAFIREMRYSYKFFVRKFETCGAFGRIRLG
jgi:hypothetical protein